MFPTPFHQSSLQTGSREPFQLIVCVSSIFWFCLCVSFFSFRPSPSRLSLLASCLHRLRGRPEGSRTRTMSRYRLNLDHRETCSAPHNNISLTLMISVLLFLHRGMFLFFFCQYSVWGRSPTPHHHCLCIWITFTLVLWLLKKKNTSVHLQRETFF